MIFYSRGLMISRDNSYLRHISSCNRPMTTKHKQHVKVVTCHEGFLLRKVHDPLNKLSQRHTTIEELNLYYDNACGHQTSQDGD